MSNTSSVTPYDSTTSAGSSTSIADAAVACAAGVVAISRWLSEETEDDRGALERLKSERQRELLGGSRPTPLLGAHRDSLNITTVGLQLRNPKSLIHTAERLGYRVETLTHSSLSLPDQPQILLRRASGERLAIACGETGRLVVHTAGDRRRVQDLVRQHTVDRAVEHLASKGMGVRTAKLASGEVQILARERDSGSRGGAAEVKAQINVDGTALVDVDKVRGNRCEEIVHDFAQAVGGEVSDMTKKDSYFQLPGEPAKTEVKV
jgi:hypothetical protein